MVESQVTQYDQVNVPGGQVQAPEVLKELIAVQTVHLLELVGPFGPRSRVDQDVDFRCLDDQAVQAQPYPIPSVRFDLGFPLGFGNPAEHATPIE
jgi:hypothetical protein